MKTIIIIIAMFVVGCTGRISDLSIGDDEAIILMRARVITPEREEISGCRFFFDNSTFLRFGVRAEEYNYLYFKVNLGKHELYNIQKNERTSKVPSQTLSFNVSESGIYYLGDVTFLAEFNYNKKNLAEVITFFGMWFEHNENKHIDNSQYLIYPLYALGVLYDEFRSENAAKIKVENNFEKDVKYFNNKFGNTEEIKLLNINSTMIDTVLVNSYIDNKLSDGEFMEYKSTLIPNEEGELFDSTGRKVNPMFKVRK